MASSIIELYVDVPADRQANIFGQFDEHLKLIERTLNVTMIFRDGSLKILGSQEGATQAKAIVEELNTLAGRGNTITQQNVNYALSLAMEKIGSVMEEIDKDFICNTIQGRPIKPKTLGQKDYVEQIRKKMIVFGVGPAGTGKTYLAMAMAIQAFKNEEVARIILTRPAIEAGEKLGFLPGDLQSKVDPYLRPLYDALYQIMGPESFQKNMEKGFIILFKNLPKTFTKFVFINNSVATKNGKSAGTTEFAHNDNPFFIAGKLLLENSSKLAPKAKNISAKIFLFIFNTKK